MKLNCPRTLIIATVAAKHPKKEMGLVGMVWSSFSFNGSFKCLFVFSFTFSTLKGNANKMRLVQDDLHPAF